MYDDWDIFHVEIELQILPPHARDRIKIRVHEYTQEILSSEDEDEDEGGGRQDEDEQDGLLCDFGEGPADGCCLQWDLSLDELCSSQAEGKSALCLQDDEKLPELCWQDDEKLSELCLQKYTSLELCLQDDASLELCLQDDGKLPELCLQDDGKLPELCLQDDGKLPELCLQDDANLELCLQEDEHFNLRFQDYGKLELLLQDDANTELCLQDDGKYDLSLKNDDKMEQCLLGDCRLSKKCLLDDGHVHFDEFHPLDGEIFTSESCFHQGSNSHRKMAAGRREENADVKKSPPDCRQHDQEMLPKCPHESTTSLFQRVQNWLPSRGVRWTRASEKQDSDLSRTDSSPSSCCVRDVPGANKRSTRHVTRTVTVEPKSRRLISDTNSVQRIKASTSSDGTSSSRRQLLSEPIPMLKSCTTASASWKPPAASKKRKFSLRDEPGWIPNPLDSDSDSSDFEDSGVFSDATGSPETSASPCGFLSPSWLTQKRAALLSDRKRCNSEPTSVTPTTSSSGTTFRQGGKGLVTSQEQARSSSTSDNSTGKKSDSKWSLVKSSWRRLKPQTATSEPLELPSSPPEKDDEEDDLDEQLEWLTKMTDSSQLSQETDSSSEELDEDPHQAENATILPDDSAHEENPEASQLVSASLPEERNRRPFEHELELDWLCEPEWNNFELELFWSVLRPYLEQLLEDSDHVDLPEPLVTICNMDTRDHKMLDRYGQFVRRSHRGNRVGKRSLGVLCMIATVLTLRSLFALVVVLVFFVLF